MPDRAGSGASWNASPDVRRQIRTAAPPLSMSATDWLLLLVLSVLWGGSFYFAKIAVLEIPPLTLALGRVAIAAAALAIFARAHRPSRSRATRATWRHADRDGGAQQRRCRSR